MNEPNPATTPCPIGCLLKTSDAKLLLVLRLVAGLPLLFFGILHFIKLTAFAEILIASGLPFVEFNKFAAPTLEVLAGLLLIPGFLSRLGGLLAVLTMGPAIYGTFAIHALTPDHLPPGLEQIPQVPPLAVPIVILLIGLLLAILGGGGLSLDRKLSTRHDC